MTGAQFEIRIDGTPRSYRDRKDYAMEAARLIKSKNPHSNLELPLLLGWPHPLNTRPGRHTVRNRHGATRRANA